MKPKKTVSRFQQLGNSPPPVALSPYALKSDLSHAAIELVDVAVEMNLVALYAAGKTRPAGLGHNLKLIYPTLDHEEPGRHFRSEIEVDSNLANDCSRRWKSIQRPR